MKSSFLDSSVLASMARELRFRSLDNESVLDIRYNLQCLLSLRKSQWDKELAMNNLDCIRSQPDIYFQYHLPDYHVVLNLLLPEYKSILQNISRSELHYTPRCNNDPDCMECTQPEMSSMSHH